MSSTFRIYSHFTSYLAQLDVPTTPRSWVLNGYGKAEFSVGTTYLRERFNPQEEAILQYGNLVYIEHVPTTNPDATRNGKLPDWVGIILPERTWSQGVVNLTAYSAEAILTFRPMPLTKISGTPATMFKAILNMARMSADDIVIQPGIIEDVPETYSDTLATSAYAHINKLCQNARMNWDVTAQIDTKGQLQLYANLYRVKGNGSGLELNPLNSEPPPTNETLTSDNTENTAPLLTEQGTPYNLIYGYSDASTKESRHFAIGRNQASIDKYGVLATNHVFSGIKDKASLQLAAQAMADASPPVMMVRRVALDAGDTFDSIAAGNIVTVKDTNAGFKLGGGFGFETTARILSLDYNDLSNKAPLNLEIF